MDAACGICSQPSGGCEGVARACVRRRWHCCGAFVADVPCGYLFRFGLSWLDSWVESSQWMPPMAQFLSEDCGGQASPIPTPALLERAGSDSGPIPTPALPLKGRGTTAGAAAGKSLRSYPGRRLLVEERVQTTLAFGGNAQAGDQRGVVAVGALGAFRRHAGHAQRELLGFVLRDRAAFAEPV